MTAGSRQQHVAQVRPASEPGGGETAGRDSGSSEDLR